MKPVIWNCIESESLSPRAGHSSGVETCSRRQVAEVLPAAPECLPTRWTVPPPPQVAPQLGHATPEVAHRQWFLDRPPQPLCQNLNRQWVDVYHRKRSWFHAGSVTQLQEPYRNGATEAQQTSDSRSKTGIKIEFGAYLPLC